jgi:transposase InsO family protein
VGEQDSLKTLERENRELRRANEILKSAAAFLGAELDHRPDDRLHVALVIDAFSRFLVGWQASRSLRTRPGPGCPGDGHLASPSPAGRVGPSFDRGSQYLSIRYTERLARPGR